MVEGSGTFRSSRGRHGRIWGPWSTGCLGGHGPVGHLVHGVHALALLGVAAHPGSAKWSGWLFVVGTVLFCGSLYSMVLLYVLTGHKYGVLGAITPFGGISFILAWLSLGWTTTRRVGRS